jgi:hypothetical protein
MAVFIGGIGASQESKVITEIFTGKKFSFIHKHLREMPRSAKYKESVYANENGKTIIYDIYITPAGKKYGHKSITNYF